MANSATNIDRYTFQPHDLLFLDANVWLNVYAPQRPGSRPAATYSRALSNMLNAGSKIYFDVLVASEFVNTFARICQRLDPSVSSDFKTFRNSPAFLPVAKDIGSSLRKIVAHCQRLSCTFADCDIQSVISEQEAGRSDFNDQLIADLCRKQKLTLVTDDGDFKASLDFPVITGNRSLLSRQ